MNKEKWNNVLIEWVNCLKLCKNIQNIESLRNGEFLANLQKVITKSRNAQVDTLTFIFDLFSKHYPAYSFENKTEIHLSDLPERDLKAITSLLMHYTCIFDRKDVLTSPLCHSLSQSTQLIIRNFLQKITKDVNNETMDKIIKICIDDASDHLANNQWLNVETSSFSNSPLQDLLKTPVSKMGRLHEKDRLIAKLKTELDAERYDKTELQEELKKQMDRNKKLETQLAQKSSEVSRLRSEVAALENRTPPHYQDMDSRELQRRLRAEIQCLEQYVKQVEDEEEEIRKEKDSAKELLRTVESQASMWEEKFFEAERNLEGLKEHSKKQEEELGELQAHCAEITAMLEEYRAKPENDSSLYDTFTTGDNAKLNETPPGEDLACEVVEVQLREAQKQIEELRGQLKQVEEARKALKGVKEEIEERLQKSEETNAGLIITIRDTETDKTALQNRLSEVENNLDEAKQTIQQKSTEIETLLAKLEENLESLQALDSDNKELLSKVSSLQSDHEKVRTELFETTNELQTQRNQSRDLETERDNFKAISEKLQFEIADVILSNQTLCSQLESLTTEKITLLTNLSQIETNFRVVEANLFESQRRCGGLTIELDGLYRQNDDLKNELNMKKEQLTNTEDEKVDLTRRLEQADTEIAVLSKSNVEFKSEVSDLQNQLTETLDCVKTSQKHRKQLENAQSLLEKQVSDTQSSLETLTAALAQLQVEKKQTVELLEANKASLDVLQQEKSALSSQLRNFEEIQSDLIKKNEALISDNRNLQDQLSNNVDSLKSTKEEVEDLKQGKKSLELRLEENLSLCETLKNNLDEVTLQEQKTKAMLEEAKTKLQNSEEARVNFEAQLCESQKSVQKLTKELDETKTQKERIVKLLDENKLQVSLLNEEKLTHVSLMHDSEHKCAILSKKNEDLEAHNEDLRVQLSDTIATLDSTKTEETKLKESQSLLTQQLRDAETLSDGLKKDLSETKIDNERLNEELIVVESKLRTSEEMVVNYDYRNQDLQMSVQNLKKQLTDVQGELKLNKEEVDRLIRGRNSLEVDLNEAQTVSDTVRNDLHQIELEKQQLVVELAESRENFRKIDEEKSVVLAKLEESESRCQSLEQELKSRVEDVQLKLKNTNEALQTNQMQVDKLTDSVTKLEEKLKDSRGVRNSLKKELAQVRLENKTLEEQVKESRHSVSVLQQEGETSRKKVADLENEKEKMLLEAENLAKDLREASHNLDTMKSRSKKLEKNKTKLENRLQEAHALSESLKLEKVALQAQCKNSDELKIQKNTVENQLEELKLCNYNLETQLNTANNTLECHKRDLDQLQSANRSLTEDLEQTKGKIVKIETERADLSTKLGESESRNETLRSRVTDLEQKLVDLSALVDEAELDKQKTNEDLMNAKNEIQILISKLRDYELKCLTMEQKMTDLINNLLVSTEENEETRNQFQNEKLVLVTNVSELEKKVEVLETRIQDLKSQNSDLEKVKMAHVEMTLQCDKIKEVVKQLEEEKEQMGATLEKDKESLILKLTDLEEKIQDLTNQNDNLTSQNNTLQNDLDKLAAAKESLTRVLKEKQEISDKSEQLQKKNNDLESQNTTLEQQLSEIRKRNDEVELQLHNLTTLSDDLATEKKQLEAKTDDYSKKNEELQNQLSALERNHQQLKNSKEIVDRRLNEVSVVSETLKAESEDVRLQYQKSKIEVAETREILAQLTKERDNVTASLKETNEKNDKLCQDLRLIKEKLADVENHENETKQALSKAKNEVQMLNSKNDELQKRLTDSETKSKENQEFLEGEINKLTSMTFGYKSELEDAKKRAEKAEQNLKNNKQEMVAINQKVEYLVDEKSMLDKKIEVEEIISSEQRDRIKCLEETVQDYEITISGLKSVVDSNLERLESLKEELSQRNDQQDDARRTILELLQANSITGGGDTDFKTFISDNFSKILKAKSEQETRVEALEQQVKDLKTKNIETSSFTEMIKKLQILVADKDEICSLETLKSSFDNIHAKVNKLLEAKRELSDNLQRVESDKFDLDKQLAALKIENDEAIKTKTELYNSLKQETEKVEMLRKELENKSKPVKPEKENILSVSTKSNKSREDELKKENMMLKRKVVLTENAKNNLEKVLKELREEKKKAAASSPSNDGLYKKLLQEYIEVKEENERVLKEKDRQMEDLKRENEQLRMNNVPIRNESDKKIVQDLQSIREAYGNLMSVNSKMELEMVTLRKIIEERNSEMANLAHIKEAYEKLLEENNKVLTEVDTVKYKRMRDKEEFVRLLKKEREELGNREMKRIQEIRTEYEGKLEKMKEKMLKLYREEVNKKMKSVKDGENETAKLLKTVANLKSELFEADQKIQFLEMEKDILKANRRIDMDARTIQLQSVSSITSITTNEERSATLPRPSVTKEVTISKRTSIGGMSTNIGTHDLQMEDEEDLFNDKYLTDLKEGRCALPTGRDSVCRFSELAYRNSMVPPHLKSSYPAETQFISPTRFKDEDIKSGNLEFEDSLVKLLPGEKPRKKDFGTTSYKKPGPPTPSKNGGRLSLQGNEVHPMREHCEAKTPKKSTPSRIKALFTGRNSSARDESQSSVTPSRGRRLSIFRRPR